MQDIRIRFNAPVVLSFALLSFLVLMLDGLTGGVSTTQFFCVYPSSFTSPLTYIRLFGHVLGHTGFSHYLSNMTLFLVIGPPLEEKYGGRKLIFAILITAFATGVAHMIFGGNTALLGASGVVFMMIVLSSLAGSKQGGIPITLILVAVIYLGGEMVDAVTADDSVSQLAHIVGGICGIVLGLFSMGGGRGRRR